MRLVALCPVQGAWACSEAVLCCVRTMTAVDSAAGDAAIRKLNLTGNNIGDKGATLLAEMLKVGTIGPEIHAVFHTVTSLSLGLAA